MISIIKHIEVEGPGNLGAFFDSSQWDIEIIELNKTDIPCSGEQGIFPTDLSKTDGVIVLGGPMNVYEEERYPFLRYETDFLRRLLGENIPVMGICLGAQLIARAAGAKVKKAQHEEIGWYKVTLTPEGRQDRLFKGLPPVLDVFQWHMDTFDIPQNGLLLATSEGCRNQAFRYGKNAYGLQFHIEVTQEMIWDWVKEYITGSDTAMRARAQKMLADHDLIKTGFHRSLVTICRNFCEILKETKAASICR